MRFYPVLRIATLALLLSMPFLIFAQGLAPTAKELPKIENPNASSLSVFGDIPVNMSTGIPDISIPIYTLDFGKISVPISLRYHPSSVKPNQHPGWVGLGWNLQSYGSISRNLKGSVDEHCIEAQGSAQTENGFYPTMYGYVEGNSGSEKLNAANVSTSANIEQLIYSNAIAPIPSDLYADEFYFNFGTYSGKFFYGGPVKQWQVISSDDIKVELNDFFTGPQVIAEINKSQHFSPSYHIATTNGTQSRMFKGFTLTVPDGTRYVFGGIDGCEFSSDYHKQNELLFTLDNWLLKQIIDVNGNVVNFEYSRGYPNCKLYFDKNNSAVRYRSSLNGNLNDCDYPYNSNFGQVNAKNHGGTLYFPMYLNRITSANEVIEFSTSVAECLREQIDYLKYKDAWLGNQDGNYVNLKILGPVELDPANLNSLQWQKLDQIVIKNCKADIKKKFSFNYGALPMSGRRLTLYQLTERNASDIANAKYSFEYNDVEGLPATYDGDFTDHWGFFNNRTLHAADLYQVLANGTRNTDTNYVTKGLLNRITYPTGGFTSLRWEAHDYAQFVLTRRDELSLQAGYVPAGGSRIKAIQNYGLDGEIVSDRRYIYKRGFYNGANLTTLTSSGILNGIPQYQLSILNRPTSQNTAYLTIDAVSLNSLNTYSYNSQGSHIGYDEVVELNSNGSYTINFYTSYGPDLNGVPHWDKSPVVAGWLPGTDPYIVMNSLELERGKPVGIFNYSNQNKLVRKQVIKYRSDQERFSNFIKRLSFDQAYSCSDSRGITFATVNSEYIYEYYPVRVEETVYDPDGTNPFTTITENFYNSKNLLSRTRENDSKGSIVDNYFKYTFDFPSDPVLTQMAAVHIFSPVVESRRTVNGDQVNLLKTNYYSPFTGIFVPSSIQQQKGGGLETIQLFTKYDNKGNLLETKKPNDITEVYLWGYNNAFPVAKVIGGTATTHTIVAGYITLPAKLNNNNCLVYPDSDVRTELNKIRNGLLTSKALVTTYTYDSSIGITSETDPNGKTIYYEYDSFNRLKAIKDRNSNVLKTFDYLYKQ